MSVLVPPAHLLGSEVEVPCADGHAAPLRQPRLRGQHAGDGRRLGRRRGLRAVVQQRPPRHRREVAGLDRGLRARARGRRALRRRARRRASSSSATRPRPSTSSPTALPPGTRVLSTPVEHHANMLPWRRHDLQHAAVHRPRPTSCSTVTAARAAARRRSTCSPSPAPPTSPARSGRSSELAALAHAHGAQLFVDAAQLAPHRAIDDGRRPGSTTSRSPATSSTRRSAPARSSAARRWTATRCCTAAARSSSSRSTTSIWADAPDRFEAGSPNVIGAVAFAAACEALEAIGMDARRRPRARALDAPARRPEDASPACTQLALWPGHEDRVGVASFTLDGPQGRGARRAAERRLRDRRPPRLLLRAPADHAAAAGARGRGAAAARRAAPRPRARAARGGPGEHRARHDDLATSTR